MAKWKFARDAIDDRADLSEIKENPTVKNYAGIFLMCFSYILGFPAIGLLGALSIYWREPKLIMIGAPLLFIIAHLVFLAGMEDRPIERGVKRAKLTSSVVPYNREGRCDGFKGRPG